MSSLSAILRRSMAVIVMVAVLAPFAAAQTAAPAANSQPTLVFEALRALQTNYVDPVDVAKVLNAAVDALKAALSTAGVTSDLAPIPPGTPDAEAQQLFADRFAQALAAARLTKTQLSYVAIRGMTESFDDSHTGFLTPDQYKERLSRQRGQAGFTGVGIVLATKDNKFYVQAVIPGGPAEAAGVRQYDRIIRINDVNANGLQMDQVSGLIRGTPGTAVTLTLQRPAVTDPIVLTITRAPIVVPSIFRSEVLEGGVGYLKLYQFVEGTARDVRVALANMQQRKMRALVLDLRGNSGGYLYELNGVLNALLPSNLPVYTEMRQGGAVRVQRSSGPTLLPAAMPLYVLIDEGSASAAELLAAAIQENGRGQLIGEKTAGAVEASIAIPLSDESALSVTTFRLATGKGVRLEKAGVRPDVEVIQTAQDIDAGVDRVFGTAVRIVRQVLALPTR